MRRLTAQSESENVLGSVVIAIEHQSAVWAGMGTLTEIFVRSFAFTAAAHLAGLVGVHEHDADMPGALSLSTHHRDERCPPNIDNILFNPPLAAAPLGKNSPVVASCFGLGRLLIGIKS